MAALLDRADHVDQKSRDSVALMAQFSGVGRRQRPDPMLVAQIKRAAGGVQSDQERVEVQDLDAGAEEVRGVIEKLPAPACRPVAVVLEEHWQPQQSAW